MLSHKCSNFEVKQAPLPRFHLVLLCSGYWYDAASGLHYDANTGLYYQSASQQWYSYDHSNAQYTAVGTGGTEIASEPAGSNSTTAPTAFSEPASHSKANQIKQQAVVSSAVPARTAAAAAKVASGMWANPSNVPGTVARAKATSLSAAPERKRASAVMGSAPKLNSQGLLVAAQQALVRKSF